MFFFRVFATFFFIYFIGDYARLLVLNTDVSFAYPTLNNFITQILASIIFTLVFYLPYSKSSAYPKKNSRVLSLLLGYAFLQLGILSLLLKHLAKFTAQNTGNFINIAGVFILINSINMIIAIIESKKIK